MVAQPNLSVEALFVGGPLHGTTRVIPDRAYMAVETRGVRSSIHDMSNWEATQVSYYPRHVVRKVGDSEWQRTVWVDHRLVNWVGQVESAVVEAWFRHGLHAKPDGTAV